MTTSAPKNRRRPAAPAKAAPPRARVPKRRGYHHGDLKVALLEAAERLLKKEGVAGLKLRAITRMVGVSHTAGDPHFGDHTGLLSELAAVGFERLGDAMLQSDGAPGRAYITFALSNRQMFTLMFRNEALNFEWPRLRAAVDRAAVVLSRAAGDQSGIAHGLPLDRASRMARAWALVHGLSLLAIGGSLNGIVRRTPGASLESLIAAALTGE